MTERSSSNGYANCMGKGDGWVALARAMPGRNRVSWFAMSGSEWFSREELETFLVPLDEDEWAVLIDNIPYVMQALHWETATSLVKTIEADGVELFHNIVGVRIEGQAALRLNGCPTHLIRPTCNLCDVLMELGSSQNGVFWRCARYPECRRSVAASNTIIVRK